MILSRIEIDNYKQYVGHHEVDVPAAATIGVIGANGVGKTTLFEAVEWCLYNPSTIANRDIRPRGIGGYTRVCVTLERTDGSGPIIVERELKRSATTAAVYAVDEQGEESVLVQGTRPVTDYVASKLVGLPHSAFVATFFTRQKELHFFGNLGDANRRREVGRLLGLETIRVAQQRIGEDRKRAADEAAMLKRQYEEQSAGRDFDAERASAESTITAQRDAVVAAAEQRDAQKNAVQRAEEHVKAINALRDQDVVLYQALTVIDAERRSAIARREGLHEDIGRLDLRERERAELVPIAARVAHLANDIAHQETERARFLRRRELSNRLHELQRRRLDLVTSLGSSVTGIRGADAFEGWGWSASDADRPAEAVGRLLTTLDLLDLAKTERQAKALSAALELERALASARSTATRYRARRDEIERQLSDLLVNGDPAEAILALERKRDDAQGQLSQLSGERPTLESQRDGSNRLIANLMAAHFEDRCPTCARPFSERDAELVITSLRERTRTIAVRLTELQRESRALEGRIRDLVDRRIELGKRAEAIVKLRGSVQDGESHIREQDERVQSLEADLADALAQIDDGQRRIVERQVASATDPFVTPQQVEHAQARLTTVRHLLDTRPVLTGASDRFAQIGAEASGFNKDLAEIGDVRFDEALHRQLVADHQAAARAESTIEQIDRELVRRPQLAADLSTVVAALETLDRDRERLARKRVTLGFEPEALVAAETELVNGRRAEQDLVEGHHLAQSALREAEHTLATIARDQDRIRALATQSDVRRAAYDSFDQMYREFTEFERFAAGRLTPLLGDFTSELVRIITDGKYDRVEFDGNFAIRVFDGDDESFALETFSGGERDAIALAARVALSRLIGTQATNQPGFLVLDEVFGSLDRDRRTRLLDLLGSISESFEDVRQVFIISHVDDVRTSAIFDGLWRIDEAPDGGSRLRSLGVGEDIGDL